jgi:hypothetical protein
MPAQAAGRAFLPAWLSLVPLRCGPVYKQCLGVPLEVQRTPNSDHSSNACTEWIMRAPSKGALNTAACSRPFNACRCRSAQALLRPAVNALQDCVCVADGCGGWRVGVRQQRLRYAVAMFACTCWQYLPTFGGNGQVDAVNQKVFDCTRGCWLRCTLG